MVDQKIREEDEMIRVSKCFYSVVRMASAKYRRKIKDIADEALSEWIQKHISKEDKKLFDQMIERR